MMSEPRIHSHITDSLPDGHPKQWDQVDCKRCHTLLHACNNECMKTWVETGDGCYCLGCWIATLKAEGTRDFELTVLEDRWALEE